MNLLYIIQYVGCQVAHRTTHLLFFFRRPTTNPTIKATIIAMTRIAMMRIRLHPPLLAIYLLFLTSPSFSPFGPVASHTLYLGGGVSKLCLGGSPIFHLRLKNRLWVLSGNGGSTPSSAIIDSLVSTELARLLRLRLPTFLERTGGAERSAKGEEPTELTGIVFSGLRGVDGGLANPCGVLCSSIDLKEEYEARSRRLDFVYGEGSGLKDDACGCLPVQPAIWLVIFVSVILGSMARRRPPTAQ